MMPDAAPFDVFLSYERRDQDAVRRIAEALREAGLRPWFDPWELQPGMRWLKELERHLDATRSAAVFVGPSGIGPWQDVEVEGFLNEMVARDKRIIPVLLPGCPDGVVLPLSLRDAPHVDLRQAETAPLERLLGHLRPTLREAVPLPAPRHPPAGAAAREPLDDAVIAEQDASLPQREETPAKQSTPSVRSFSIPAPQSSPALPFPAHAPPRPPRPRTLQAPGCRYLADWYVPHPTIEQQALAYLGDGKPVLLWGPTRIGKTWLLRHLVTQIHARHPDWRIAEVGLHDFVSEQFSSFEGFLGEMGNALVSELGVPEQLLADAWRLGGAASGRLRTFMRELLAQSEQPLVLLIDRADAVLPHDFRNDFFAMLRGWAVNHREPWPRLRLVLAVSTTPERLSSDIHYSPLEGLSDPLELEGFDRAQIVELARLHWLGDQGEALDRLVELVGGHPYLLRLGMYQAAFRGAPLERTLPPPGEDGPFGAHLDGYRRLLRTDPRLHEALRKLGTPAARDSDPEEFVTLQRIGLIQRRGGLYQLRCSLYEQLR